MNEEDLIANLDVYIRELLEVNKDINKQLATYKQKEEKIRELCEAPIDNMSLNWQTKLILQILNEGDK